MDDIEKTLKDTILVSEWSLIGDYATSKIVFTRSKFRAEEGGSFTTPCIEISHLNEKRLQAMDEFFEYTAKVTVRVWASGTKDEDIDTAKDIKQTLIEEIKRICLLYVPKGATALPTQWDSILYIGSINRDQEDLTHPLLGEELQIAIRYFYVS